MTTVVRRPRSQPGELNPAAKLTEAQVLRIRELRGAGAAYAELAADFDMSLRQIHYIVKRQKWTHLR